MTINYMPSEIARLVLGYLRETDCKESAKIFINESSHLTEYAIGLRHGITYPTNIGGKSLIDIINNFNCDLNINNENNSNNNSINEEMKTISKQISSVESCLTQLTQTINTSVNNSNYQIISPSVISSSSPLFVNTIGYNSTPIVLNEQNILNVTQNELIPNENQFKTPSKSLNSPRRKSLPRRRILSGSTPLKSNPNCDVSIDSSEINTSPDRLRDENETQLKIDINEPLVQPEMIVGELINFLPLHEALADNINKIFNNCEDNNDNSLKLIEGNNSEHKDSDNEVNEQIFETQEVQITDNVVNDIMANLELAPEYNTLLDMITEKELQMTPYKNVFSNETTSSASSLSTPKTPQIRINSQSVDNTCVVKNLMPDLVTPEKTVTLYAAQNSLSSPRITPIKVTPVKVLRTNLTPCKTLFMPDFNYITTSLPNHSLMMPNVSVNREDNSHFTNIVTQNSMSNNTNNYSIRVEANKATKPQFYNLSGASFRCKGKKVDFSKPASELQVKRSDLIHRKILPKPSNKAPISSTTITPVLIDANETLVPKQTEVIVNENTNLMKSKINNKRPNSDIVESPNKIKAAEVRFPTVNILRKMNVNKFLNRVHSNQ